MPRTVRAVAQRQAIGRRIRAYRLALGLTIRDLAAHTDCGHGQMGRVENATQDVFLGTLIDVADAVGLDVALVAGHHLPLLNCTAGEVAALREAARGLVDGIAFGLDDNLLRSALDKLTTTGTTEETS